MPKKTKEDLEIEDSENEESDKTEKTDQPSDDEGDSNDNEAQESDAEDDEEGVEEEEKPVKSRSSKTSKPPKPSSSKSSSSSKTPSSKSAKTKKPVKQDDDLYEEVKVTQKDIKNIIGDFPEISRNNQASSEVAYLTKAAFLFYIDGKQSEMAKQQVASHMLTNIKTNSGMPELSKTASGFETLRNFTAGRGNAQTGLQKLFNPNNRPVLLCLETFVTMYVNELTKNMDFKTGDKLYESVKKDRTSILAAILRFSANNPKCEMEEDYGSGEKIDEIFENYVADKNIRQYAVNALVRYLKFLGSAFATSISINKRAITFRTMFDMILITLKSYGYNMSPKTELAFMLCSEYRAKAIIKKAKEAKLLSGKKGGKGSVGKKMTEKERANNIKAAKAKPKTTKKTTTRSRK